MQASVHHLVDPLEDMFPYSETNSGTVLKQHDANLSITFQCTGYV